MTTKGEVLIAIMNKALDFSILRERLWYRIPVVNKTKLLKDKWPPKWMAFYQTKKFNHEAFSINYYGEVSDIQEVSRWELFPEKANDEKKNDKYYKISFSSINLLPKPIPSRRLRRIVFIPTNWDRFSTASEINDLFMESNLEEVIWAQFKKWNIPAERQEHVKINKQNYFLDFSIYCTKGKIAVEADGDFWHANPEKAYEDNLRDTALKLSGWEIFHFSEKQIREEMTDYCLPTINKKIVDFGGLDEGKVIPRKIDLKLPPGSYQPTLFD